MYILVCFIYIDPIKRFLSNYLYFIGDERKYLPDLYGDINSYIKHILSNTELSEIYINMIDLLQVDINTMTKEHWLDIFELYFRYLQITRKICKYEITIVSSKQKEAHRPITNYECGYDDVIRNNLLISCHIVPLMYWFVNIDNPLNVIKVIQTEMFLKYPNEHINRLICWTKGEIYGLKYCKKIGKMMNKKDEYKYKSDPAKKQSNNVLNEQISDENKEILNNLLNVCHLKLYQMLNAFPELSIMKFKFNLWNINVTF